MRAELIKWRPGRNKKQHAVNMLLEKVWLLADQATFLITWFLLSTR